MMMYAELQTYVLTWQNKQCNSESSNQSMDELGQCMQT